MAKQLAGEGPVEMPEQMLLDATQPMPGVTRRGAASQPVGAPARRPSYQPTGWAVTDRALDFVDELSGGKAEWFQRLFSYLFIGGAAALVNLAVFWVVLYRVALPVDAHVHYLIANLIAAEISIFANFIPNDRFTFSHLPGHARSWWVRCGRFHVTAIGGTIVTAVVSLGLHFAGLPGMVAQAGAIIVALIFNFTFHHLFTYRHM
jgi:putative flippase GtrA